MLKRMLSYLVPYKTWFIAGQIAMLVSTAAGLAFPWAVRGIFDRLFEAGTVQPLLLAIGTLAVVFVLTETANYAKTFALEHVGQNIIRDLRDQVYRKLLSLSLDYYGHKNSGEITSSMSNDMNLFQQGLSTGLTYILQQTLSLIAVVVLLLRLDWVLTLTVFCTMPIIMLISKKMGEKVKALSSSMQDRLGHLMSIITQSISGIDIIKAFVLENYALEMFRDQNDRIRDKSLHSVQVSAGARLIIGLLNSLFLLVVIGLGGYRVFRGFLSSADLIAFILYSEMIAGPIAMLSGIYVEINKAIVAFERISAILNTPTAIASPADALKPERLQEQAKDSTMCDAAHRLNSPAIEFRNISFSYDGHKEIVKDITFTIQPGETVALVGPSGVGKSTLIKLIPRFYDPTAGAVLIDQIDIRRFDLEFLRSQIAVVPQETFLFDMSIQDNIACGRPDASQGEIEQAARLANAHEFIMELENGYQTLVGERGARLSGGQKQRIAIARAFLKNPRILILDEATSSLDTYSERKVQDALERLMRGDELNRRRTTLIIAHRLSTIERADKIMVLRDGRILAQGTHRELLDSCPFYGDLYKNQFASPISPSLIPAWV